MKREFFKEELNEIHADEELIARTIQNIKNIEKAKKNIMVKRIVAGTATAVVLSIGSVAAYVATTREY